MLLFLTLSRPRLPPMVIHAYLQMGSPVSTPPRFTFSTPRPLTTSSSSPHGAPIARCHGRPGRAAEGRGEGGELAERTDDTVLLWRMGVGEEGLDLSLIANICAPRLREGWSRHGRVGQRGLRDGEARLLVERR